MRARVKGSVRSSDGVRPRNMKFSNVADVFCDESIRHTSKEVWELYGGNYRYVNIALNRYCGYGILFKEGNGKSATYRLTTDNDVINILSKIQKEIEAEKTIKF